MPLNFSHDKAFLKGGFHVGKKICILNVYETLVQDNSGIRMSEIAKKVAYTCGVLQSGVYNMLKG